LKAFIHCCLILCALGYSGAQSLHGEATALQENQVKAVFLFNFAQFVDWPASAFPDPRSPLVIGILGDDPFDGYLDATVKGEMVNGRPLMVQRYRRVEEIKRCQVLFISGSETGRLPKILSTLAGRQILTVGDAEGFATNGGMIRFVTARNKVRFRINLGAAQAAGLSISSKLLRAADVVKRGGD
jgi:hypothetical protein